MSNSDLPLVHELSPSARQVDLRRPFFRVDGHAVHVDRITACEFLETGIVYRVGEKVTFFKDIAREWSQDTGQSVEDVKTHILVIKYINDKGLDDLIRRHGKQADDLWEFICEYLCIN